MSTPPSNPRVSLLVTDLDNTLFDWFSMWYASFGSMLSALSEMSGLPQTVLEQEIRIVHQRRGTSEYSYLLNEIPSLQALHPGEDVATVYGEAIHRYRSARKATAALYPTVRDTLLAVQHAGVPVVGYTESREYYTTWRLRELGLDGVLDYVYSPQDHDFPDGVSPAALRSRCTEDYGLRHTQVRHTPEGVHKPSANILRSIVDAFAVPPSRVVYAGDSLMKDVAMAQSVGALDVLAEYGISQHKEGYELLRRVSHWSDEDVERERQISEAGVDPPSYRLRENFSELLELFDFQGE
jgi:phosphoglycolate phosphatase-like HAD superfamily hydrolase